MRDKRQYPHLLGPPKHQYVRTITNVQNDVSKHSRTCEHVTHLQVYKAGDLHMPVPSYVPREGPDLVSGKLCSGIANTTSKTHCRHLFHRGGQARAAASGKPHQVALGTVSLVQGYG
eukprot:61667-Pelagomonas_calceolata.AAC.4